MKTKYFLLIILLVAAACNNNDGRSDAYGNFESEPVLVSAEASGKLLMFTLEQGQTIEASAMVGIIDTTQAVLTKGQLNAQQEAVNAKKSTIQSQVAVYEEQIKTLKINEARIREMLKDGASTQKQLDDITGQISVVEKQIAATKTQFTSVLKEIEVVEAQKKFVDEQYNHCFVKSPISGTILDTYAEQGEVTAAGKTLFKIADISQLILKVYVSGSQISSVKIGQQVEVLIDQNEKENQKLTGEVSWISPEAEFTPKIIQTKEERVKLVYAVKIRVKNDGRLKIGMPGEANF
jgi:HlyD family secretion protein